MIDPKELLLGTKEHSEEDYSAAETYCKGYMEYLNAGKTERECVKETIKILEKNGFKPFEAGKEYKTGDKVYKNHRNKSIFALKVGENKNGVKIVAAHIDSPRLDLKIKPLYEDTDLAFFKTHYYGGIKKYQWVALPLALHGVIVKKNGETIDVVLGENETEPCFAITDLLPHLGEEQSKRTLSDGIRGEELNVLIGSIPFKTDEKSEKVKLNIISLLNQKYGIVEGDFFSAELCLVPAFKAREIGFDCSMIGSYGHDDRVCAYPAITALLEMDERNSGLLVLADKEEIGSEGNTGLNSSALEFFLNDIALSLKCDALDFIRASEAISSDVTAAYDPTFSSVYDKLNSSFLSKGVAIMKYTGARGKYDTSDASAEFCGKIRNILDSNEVEWQTCELGKVDAGGGGTVAKYIASLDMDVIDVGVPVLSMHSPFEIASKLDILSAHKAFVAFLNN